LNGGTSRPEPWNKGIERILKVKRNEARIDNHTLGATKKEGEETGMIASAKMVDSEMAISDAKIFVSPSVI